MPIKYGKIKKYKKKTMGKNKKPDREFRFGQTDPYKIKPEPFPRVLITRGKFGREKQLTVPYLSALSVGETFRLNSIYDPLWNAGGTTIRGWGDLDGLYHDYTVYGAKVNISFFDPTGDGIRVGAKLRLEYGDSAIGIALPTIVDMPMTYISGLANSGKQRKVFNLYVKPWSLLGVSKLEYMANPSGFSSAMNSSPTRSAFLDVFAVQPHGTADLNVDFMIKITYYFKCYNRKGVASV